MDHFIVHHAVFNETLIGGCMGKMSYSFKSFGLLKLENEKYTAYGKDDGCLVSGSSHSPSCSF